jgi:hypothetical protein
LLNRRMNDPAAAHTDTWWRRWAAPARAWGPPGNERLTTSIGLVLLVLLGIETLTTLALHSYLPEHILRRALAPASSGPHEIRTGSSRE